MPRDDRKETIFATTCFPLAFAVPQKHPLTMISPTNKLSIGTAKIMLSQDMSPQNYLQLRKEFEDVKQNQRKYTEEKEKRGLQTKFIRILNNRYKGAVPGIDSIYNPATQMYKEQQQNIVKEWYEKEKIREKRTDSIYLSRHKDQNIY